MPMERVNVAMEILRMAAQQDSKIPDAMRIAAEEVVLRFLTGPKTNKEQEYDDFAHLETPSVVYDR